jgi:hypothetical protein
LWEQTALFPYGLRTVKRNDSRKDLHNSAAFHRRWPVSSFDSRQNIQARAVKIHMTAIMGCA